MTFSYWINSTPSIYNFTVNTTNTPTAEIRTNITVLNDVTISTGAGLDASTLNNNLTVGRHFINNGTFTQQAATVTFNGTVLQNINGTSNTTFYNLTADNTAGPTTTGITLQRPTTVTNILTLHKRTYHNKQHKPPNTKFSSISILLKWFYFIICKWSNR